MEEDPEEFDSSEDDDLMDFQEYQQEQINLEVMKNAPGQKVSDDAEYINADKKDAKKEVKKK